MDGFTLKYYTMKHCILLVLSIIFFSCVPIRIQVWRICLNLTNSRSWSLNRTHFMPDGKKNLFLKPGWWMTWKGLPVGRWQALVRWAIPQNMPRMVNNPCDSVLHCVMKNIIKRTGVNGVHLTEPRRNFIPSVAVWCSSGLVSVQPDIFLGIRTSDYHSDLLPLSSNWEWGTVYRATYPRKYHFIQDLKPGVWNHVLFEIPISTGIKWNFSR